MEHLTLTLRLLFVCTGNTCRSPMAEAVMRAKAAAVGLAVEVDSAGTGPAPEGRPPDPRADVATARRGYPLADRRSRLIRVEDFRAFDLILAMTARHLDILRRQRPADADAGLEHVMHHADRWLDVDIADPIDGGQAGYESALDMIEAGVDGLVAHLLQRLEG